MDGVEGSSCLMWSTFIGATPLMIDIVQDASSFEAFGVLSVRKGARSPVRAGTMERKYNARDMLLNYIIYKLI